MAITKEKKEHIVSKLSGLFKKTDLLVFLKFRGLSVAKVGELRRKLRAAGASYVVAKKRLACLVLKNEGIEMPKLDGEVAFITSGEEPLTTAKGLHAFTKKNREEATILGGVFEKHIVDANTIVRLALIPPREVLLSQALGVLAGPLRGFMGVLNGNQRKLVTILSELAKKKN